MSDELMQSEPKDYSDYPTPSIPADDLVAVPFKPMARIMESSEMLAFLERSLCDAGEGETKEVSR